MPINTGSEVARSSRTILKLSYATIHYSTFSTKDSNLKKFTVAALSNGAGAESQSGSSPEENNALTTTIKQTKPRMEDKMTEFLFLLLGLLERPYSTGQTISAAGNVVLERVKNDAQSLQELDIVNPQYVFELLRLLQLLKLDLEMLASSRKESTFLERLEQAKANCRQAIEITKVINQSL